MTVKEDFKSCSEGLSVQVSVFNVDQYWSGINQVHYMLTSNLQFNIQKLPQLCFSERAKAFWEKSDVDKVFSKVLGHLNHLKMVLKKNTATDKGWGL